MTFYLYVVGFLHTFILAFMIFFVICSRLYFFILLIMFFFFFFQAEDGIRDKLVTGVQTCALPISTYSAKRLIQQGGAGGFACRSHGHNQWSASKLNKFPTTVMHPRSEAIGLR